MNFGETNVNMVLLLRNPVGVILLSFHNI